MLHRVLSPANAHQEFVDCGLIDGHLSKAVICRRTRARAKLVLLGSATTLATVPLFAGLLSLMRNREWLHTLPSDAGQDTGIAALLPQVVRQQS